MNTIRSRKNPIFSRGVLENAGLGEVSFFLKRAKQEILYAAMALEHTDFSSLDEFSALQANVVRVRDIIAELSDGIDRTAIGLAAEAERRESLSEEEKEEENV